MIVLDTNVLSEPLRKYPDSRAMAWLGGLSESASITSITAAEILSGVGLLPRGKRRDGLRNAVEGLLSEFADRVLPFDLGAARRYAEVREVRANAGHPLSVEDGMIAAICASRGMRLATRNTKDFEGLGLNLIDPWSA